jgi:large subunit ribosomal protein L13
MKTYSAKKSEVVPRWYVVDAQGRVLGRLAARIATILQGKHKPIYTPHVDTGDFVVVINAGKIKVTGKKLEQKEYRRYSGYPGGLHSRKLGEMLERFPTRVIEQAVRRMLPKTKLGRAMFKKLKVYAGPEHPHEAQQPAPLPLASTLAREG